MKPLPYFILLTILIFGTNVNAQNAITIYQTDGQQFSFGFDEKPVIKYSENELILTTNNTEIIFPLDDVSKYAFTDMGAKRIKQFGNREKIDSLDEKRILHKVVSGIVTLSGAKPDAMVMLINIDGKMLGQYKTDSVGRVSFNIANLPTGVYIIKSETQTFKILKR